jgi:predicted DCC family thiol-disulfide oxidoreductase YuxK
MDRQAIETEPRALVLFDGECRLCHRVVRFIAQRDPHGHIVFAPFQSDLAISLLTPHEVPSCARETLVLLDGTGAYTRSTAALRILRYLNRPWPVLYCLIIIPPVLRDALYRMIARLRHRLGGARRPSGPPAIVHERIRGGSDDDWRH